MQRRTGHILAPRRAFTLTELLVVIAIIVLLLGTLFVAINAAGSRPADVVHEQSQAGGPGDAHAP